MADGDSNMNGPSNTGQSGSSTYGSENEGDIMRVAVAIQAAEASAVPVLVMVAESRFRHAACVSILS